MIKKHAKLKTSLLILSVLVLMALIIFLVGRSFGFFQYAKKGDVINIIAINGLNVSIDNTTDDALNLTNSFPEYDIDGLNHDPFVFNVRNSSAKPIDYTLKLLNDEEKQNLCFVDEEETVKCTLLPYQYIKYSYSINDGEYSTPANLTASGNIYSESIAGKANTKIALKIWIDSNAPNSIQGNAFFGKLVLSGEKSIFNSNLPAKITVGDSYEIGSNSNVSCSSNIDGVVTNTSSLTVGTHVLTCTSNGSSSSITINVINLPGLYKSNGDLLANWDTLVNTYNLNVERDYDGTTNNNDNGTDGNSAYYVISNNFSSYSKMQMILPDTVTRIGVLAFKGTGKLSNIELSSGLTEIGEQAFYTSGLTAIDIPASVTTIGQKAFNFSKSLTNINISSDNPNYTAEDGIIYNKDKTTLYFYPSATGVITIPNGVKILEYTSFFGTTVTEVTIPDSVTNINTNAFYSISTLTKIKFGTGLKKISKNAFYGCTGLTSAIFDDPNNWSVTSSSSATTGDNIDVTDPSIAATLLSSTHTNKYIIKGSN